MKALILAGGKGARLGEKTKRIPKALIKIGEKPVIERQIIFLKESGIKEIWILLGYLGNKIKKYLGNGKKWGVNIRYHQEKKLLGTGGAIKTLEKEERKEFLLLSGDIMLDFDVKRFVDWHKQKKGIASIIVHPNDHPLDSDLVEVNDKGEILSLLRRPHPKGRSFRNLSIASVYIFSPKIFKYIPKNKKNDIEKDILPLLLKSKEKIYAYNTPEYLKDMGTPDRLAKVKADYASGKIKKLNLKNKRKAIFLDRDGVINEDIGWLHKFKDFEILSGVAKVIKKINDSEFLAIVITNQPVVARGLCSIKELEEIHKKMETLLVREGAKLDRIYYCPHHPDKGFPEENPKYKIKCNCRKPKIGLVKRAEKDFNIDLKKSYFIGDSFRDILCGKRAGSITIEVGAGNGCEDGKVKPDYFFDNLNQAVDFIINNEENSFN